MGTWEREREKREKEEGKRAAGRERAEAEVIALVEHPDLLGRLNKVLIFPVNKTPECMPVLWENRFSLGVCTVCTILN